MSIPGTICYLADNNPEECRITNIIMVGDAALINLVRRILHRLEEQMSPDDPALRELKLSMLRSVSELKLTRMPGTSAFPESKTA